MKIYITHLLQILNFSSPFRRFEIKNFLRQPTMGADNISNFVPPPPPPPPEFFSFLRAWYLQLNLSRCRFVHFISGLKDLLILHRSDSSERTAWYITFEQYSDIWWLCWWKIEIGDRT